MNLVGVRHKLNDRIYWFEASHDALEFGRIVLGDSVLCCTKKGKQPGIVVAMVYNASNEEVVKITGRGQHNHIIGVWREVPIESIEIKEDFAKTTPAESKLEKRREEFLTTGTFDTRVTIRDNATQRRPILDDGYTAYLVAKEFGKKYLRCFHKFVFI